MQVMLLSPVATRALGHTQVYCCFPYARKENTMAHSYIRISHPLSLPQCLLPASYVTATSAPMHFARAEIAPALRHALSDLGLPSHRRLGAHNASYAAAVLYTTVNESISSRRI